MVRAYWRRFAELATGFVHKYRRDIFYRTGWNVVLLQIGFAALLLFLALAALNLLYNQTVTGLITAIVDSLASGTSPTLDSISITADLEYEKEKSMLLTATGILTLAAIFGWLITRIALTPTRNALESQKQFVGNIAHELRTPLSIIKTNTEVALFDQNLSQSQKETLTSNVEELDRISDIINNLLSMNALLRPEKMEFKDVELGPVVDRVVHSLGELAEHKHIELTVRQGEYQTVWGNASAIEQIIMNITKNALNYTQPGGAVTLSTEPTYHGQVEIAVEDTGMGIPEKDLGRIFEPFFRGDSSRNRKSGGGSGLGLAIVSELVKLHKGTIAIRSAEQRGTVVTITLPCGRNLPKENPTHDGESEIRVDYT